MSYLEIQNMMGSESFKAGMLCGLMGIAGFCLINMMVDMLLHNANRLYLKIKSFVKKKIDKKSEPDVFEYIKKSECVECLNYECDLGGMNCLCGCTLYYGNCKHFEPR